VLDPGSFTSPYGTLSLAGCYLNWPGGQGSQGSVVVPVPCGSGLKLLGLPWVVVVVVVWNFSCFSFFPEVVVVHSTAPWSPRSQLDGSGAAKATGAESATTKRAATIAKLMRLIKLCILPLLHSPNAYETQVTPGRMCVCGGWAPCVCLCLDTNKRPALCL